MKKQIKRPAKYWADRVEYVVCKLCNTKIQRREVARHERRKKHKDLEEMKRLLMSINLRG